MYDIMLTFSVQLSLMDPSGLRNSDGAFSTSVSPSLALQGECILSVESTQLQGSHEHQCHIGWLQQYLLYPGPEPQNLVVKTKVLVPRADIGDISNDMSQCAVIQSKQMLGLPITIHISSGTSLQDWQASQRQPDIHF